MLVGLSKTLINVNNSSKPTQYRVFTILYHLRIMNNQTVSAEMEKSTLNLSPLHLRDDVIIEKNPDQVTGVLKGGR